MAKAQKQIEACGNAFVSKEGQAYPKFAELIQNLDSALVLGHEGPIQHLDSALLSKGGRSLCKIWIAPFSQVRKEPIQYLDSALL